MLHPATNARTYHEVTGDIVCPSMVQGIDHLRDPRLNKVGATVFTCNKQIIIKFNAFVLIKQGLAFTLEERQVLGIHGLQPARFKTQEEQLQLCLISINRYQEDLNKYLYLVDLQVNVHFFLLLNSKQKYFMQNNVLHKKNQKKS